MRHNPLDIEHMVVPDGHHPRRWLSSPETEPIGGEPELTDGLAEHLDCHPASAEQAARTAFGMTHDPGNFAPYPSNGGAAITGFNARVAADNRSYLLAIGVLAFGLVLSLGTLLWLGPGWLRPAPAKIALDNPAAWCTGFSGLSCTKNDKAGK